MKTSDSIKEIAAALAKAQAAMTGAKKDAKNPHFRNDYATLASVIEAIREPFGVNGLSYMQGLAAEGNALVVTTRIAHASGEWIEDSLAVPLAKHDAQGMGSAATYGRRYGLAALTGVAQVDDDGNDAATRAPAPSAAFEPPVQLDNAVVLEFEAAQSLEKVAALWNGLPKEKRAAYRTVKEKALERTKQTPALAEQA